MHAITAIGQHTRSDDVGHGMPSPPLDSTDGRTTSGVACHHSPWTSNMVERCEAWHAIIAFGQHRRSDSVGHCMPSSPLDDKHGRSDVGRGMPSLPLGSTDSRTTSGVACHHRLWPAHTVERCRGWHDITALGQHTTVGNVRRGMMTSPHLNSTHDRQRQA